jgi:hypothetical protein
MAERLGIDDFLNHGEKSRGADFADWRDKGKLTFWIHPKSSIWAVWFHRWYRPDSADGNPLTEFKSMRMNCIEHPSINRKQNYRYDNDEREVPPVICPHCLLIEWMRSEIAHGRLDWTKPVFRFGDGDDAITLHAGGLTGLFSKKDMTDSELRSLSRAKIRRDEAWKENTRSGENYIFTIIDHDDPASGAKIAMEKPTLGNQVKRCINDRRLDFERAKKDPDLGNPLLHPYAFEWGYDDKQAFDKKYSTRVLTQLEIDDDIQAAMDAEPPSIDRLVSEPDWSAYRASLEKYALIDMPIADFFKPLEARDGKPIDATADEADSEDEDEDDLPENWGGKAKTAAPDEDDHMVECDVCKKPMHEDLMVCPHCSAEYETNAAGEVVLKKKRTRTRST